MKKKQRGGIPAMPSEMEADIIQTYQTNPNATQIAAQRGDVAVSTVLKKVRKAGLEVASRGRKPMPAEKREAIIGALRKNPNPRYVAEQIGDVSHVTIWKIANEEKIPLPGKSVRTRPRIKRLVEPK